MNLISRGMRFHTLVSLSPPGMRIRMNLTSPGMREGEVTIGAYQEMLNSYEKV